jgi:transcriptional regulator with XRE-family HTH domain
LHRTLDLMAQAKRSRGRPRTRENRLARWIDASGKTRDEVAKEIGVNRTYLDMLCRGARRPGLRLAIAIEKVTRGAIPATEWLTARTSSPR